MEEISEVIQKNKQYFKKFFKKTLIEKKSN